MFDFSGNSENFLDKKVVVIQSRATKLSSYELDFLLTFLENLQMGTLTVLLDGGTLRLRELIESTGELVPNLGILSYPTRSDSSMLDHQHLFAREGVVLKVEAF